MSSPIIQVWNYRYPFGQSQVQQTKVIEMQYFNDLEQLHQKKKELTKKSELINNPTIIKPHSIQQKGMALVYNYQFVAHSFESYLRKKFVEQPEEVWSMTKKLFSKKVTFELTLLTSYLAKMKIQTELALHNLGVNKDEKLKLYVSPKSKMGIKQEIQLIIVYNQNKQKIVKQLQNLFSLIQNNTPRTYEPTENETRQRQQTSRNCSQIFSSLQIQSQNRQQNDIFSKLQNNPSQSFLRQTRNFKDSQSFRPRKMSTGNFEMNSSSNLFKTFQSQKPQETKTPKAHKYSFQFGSPADESSFNHKSFIDQQEPQPNYSKAKSIKIELEQKQNLDSKKKRKDSYKVKITTVRQYDLGQNPSNLFPAGVPSNEEDIFQYFAKRSKGKTQSEDFSQDPEKSEDKYIKQTVNTNFTNHEVPEPPSPFSTYSAKQRKQSENSSSRNRMLQQRIRQAKERTTKALNLMKNLKK